MRFGVVLGSGGGAMATMKLPFRLGLGGPIGSGRQWFPWIHLDDLVGAILFLLDCRGVLRRVQLHRTANGPSEGIRPATRATLHRPAFLPTPAFVMKLVLGEFGRSLLQGQKVLPKALLAYGYLFHYPELQPALRDILG